METVITEIDGGIGRVVLNRPERHNALTDAMYREIDAAFRQLVDASEVRCVVFAGQGESFCGGFDLSESDSASQTDVWAQWRHLQDQRSILRNIWNSPKPTVCEVKGYCLGGGMSLLNHCDFAVSAADATFGEPEIKYSLLPQPKLLYYLPLRQAKEIMLLGQNFSANEAHRIGLVNRVVPPAELRNCSDAFANSLAAMPPETMRMARRIINATLNAQGYELMADWGWDDFLISKITETADRALFRSTKDGEGLRAAFGAISAKHSNEV